MELTPNERLFLFNQYKILEYLAPVQDDKDYYQRCWKTLEGGFSGDYDFDSFLSPQMTKEECDEVVDILDTHRSLLRAAERNGIGDIRFAGFDGNNESGHLRLAKFLIAPKGQWDEFKHQDLNSHHSTLLHYRAMVREWKRSANKYDLTRDDVTRISGAQ
jgi:uncharacterized protein YfbU (UPF0304 family)